MAPKEKPLNLESLPETFRRVVVKYMAQENLDLAQALEKLSVIIDKNSEEYEQELRSKSNTLYKSRHFSELNQARAKWKLDHEKALIEQRSKGYHAGKKWVYENEQVWHVPCSSCNEPMTFTSKDGNFKETYAVLCEAFKDWRHTECSSSS